MKINLPRKVELHIEASRWPWHNEPSGWWNGYDKAKREGWSNKDKPMGRFGGGWNYSLGVRISRTCLSFDLLYGIVKIRYTTQAMRDEDAAAKARLDADVAATKPAKVEALLNGEWSDKHGTGNSIG